MTNRNTTVADLEDFAFIPKSREDLREKQTKDRMLSAFKLFESDRTTGLCDVREIGTIVRSLGLNPTEGQLGKMIESMEDAESSGYIHYDRFAAVMGPVLLTWEFQGQIMVRDSEDRILAAFRALDKDRKGYIDSDQLKEMMTTMGEKLNNEEVLEMINAAADPESGNIKYDDYAPILALD